ncbi:MAG: ABC transporter permease [Atribacterota bacterium]
MIDINIILNAVGEHLFLAYSALFISIMLAIPLAIISLYNHYLASLLLVLANLVQAIPSFAVVAIVVPLLGIGFKPAIFAIILRIILPLFKNTFTGLKDVDFVYIDSARGIGLNKIEILRYIRFPHAFPAIFAGIKFAAVIANSVAILTSLIGAGGLGEPIFEGLTNFNIPKVLTGAIPAMVIAILLDLSFSLIEKRISLEN